MREGVLVFVDDEFEPVITGIELGSFCPVAGVLRIVVRSFVVFEIRLTAFVAETAAAAELSERGFVGYLHFSHPFEGEFCSRHLGSR